MVGSGIGNGIGIGSGTRCRRNRVEMVLESGHDGLGIGEKMASESGQDGL